MKKPKPDPNPPPAPDPADPLYARALLTGSHSLDALDKEFGVDADDDPIDLNAVPRQKIHEYDLAKVLPSPAVARYLDSGDPLTHAAINKMELALEEHYNLAPPWFITSERSGAEDAGTLRVAYFYLSRETTPAP